MPPTHSRGVYSVSPEKCASSISGTQGGNDVRTDGSQYDKDFYSKAASYSGVVIIAVSDPWQDTWRYVSVPAASIPCEFRLVPDRRLSNFTPFSSLQANGRGGVSEVLGVVCIARGEWKAVASQSIEKAIIASYPRISMCQHVG